MKRLPSIAIFLFIVAVGVYYFYSTNLDFRNLVRELLQSDKPPLDTLVTNSLMPADANGGASAKKKIPKAIKPDQFHLLDDYARKTPKQYEKDIHTLTQYLIIPATTDLEKVRVIFTWMATHVNYDADAYNSGNYPDYSAENVLLNKKAVCDGYGNLMKILCEAAGLEAEKITGYAKGYGYTVGDKFTETNHAWNAVKIEGKWRLFDATWGGGFGTKKNGKLVSTLKFEPYWFDVHPKAFIFTHLPKQVKWQLTGGTLPLDRYETLPYLTESFFKLGFNPDKIYGEALSNRTTEFFETYSTDYPIKVIQVPYAKSQIRNNELKFEIQSEYAEEIALIDGSSWLYFSKDKNIFSLTHRPLGKQLQICVKINRYDRNFSTIIKYTVIDKGKIAAVCKRNVTSGG